MYNNLKNYLNTHRKSVLTVSVVALLAVGAMLLGRAGYLGGSGSNLTGALINSRGTALTQQTLKNPSNLKIRPPVSKTGTLNVSTNLTDGSYRINIDKLGTIVGSGTGTTVTKFSLPEGTYVVTFNGVKGYTTPQPVTNYLQVGSTFDIKGNYMPFAPVAATGTFNIQVSPANASYKIEDGATGALMISGTGSNTFKLPAGQYLLTFQSLPNYTAPASEKLIITAGGVLSNSWKYTPNVVPSGTLDVSRASIPVSSTYVKGQSKVSGLGISMSAGASSDIEVSKITVRLYGNNAPSPWANNALGNTAANTLVQRVTLYSGNDVVASSSALSLKDYDGNGAFTPNTDWYEASFSNVGLKINKGTTMVLTATVDLMNTMTGTTYLAVDMMPAVDMVAQDSAGNMVSLLGQYLNGNDSHNPLITIMPNGALNVTSENNPSASTLSEGSLNNRVTSYRISALHEGFTMNRVTVINDLSGAFDTPENTVAVSRVTLKYTDVNAVTQTASGSLSNGAATFSGLTLYVPAGESVYAEIYADVTSELAVGPGLAGQSFRLGLQDSGLEAVGALSRTTLGNLTINNSSSVNAMTVAGTQQTNLTVAKNPGVSSMLIMGENTLLSFNMTADNAGNARFTDLTFAVNGRVTPTSYSLYRENTLLATSPTPSFTLQQTETIAAGTTHNYLLKGTVSGMTLIDDSLTTVLDSDGIATMNTIAGTPISHTLTR